MTNIRNSDISMAYVIDSDQESKETNGIVDELYWYYADSSYGLLYIGIIRNKKYNSTENIYKATILEMVKLLAREEILIQLLEDWLQEGLLLKPYSGKQNYTHQIVIQKNSSLSTDSKGKLYLKLSDASLNSMPSPYGILKKDVSIYTSKIPAELILSKNTITSNITDKLIPGSILLIPDSYVPSWTMQIVSNVNSRIIITGNIATDMRTITVDNSMCNVADITSVNANVKQDESYIQVHVITEMKIPLDMIFGWNIDGKYLLPKPLINYKINLVMDGAIIASGHLLAINNGYGVFIDTI